MAVPPPHLVGEGFEWKATTSEKNLPVDLCLLDEDEFRDFPVKTGPVRVKAKMPEQERRQLEVDFHQGEPSEEACARQRPHGHQQKDRNDPNSCYL